jgi:hypothetical protein
MRLIERHPVSRLPKIVRSSDADRRLETFLSMEIEDALTARRTVDKVWNEARRQYNGVPKRPMREVPVPNAPNIEITLGATLADDVCAQASDALFTATPLITVRAVDAKWVEHAKAAQDWINWLAANEIGLREAANHALVDTCQLGTGVYYIPFVEMTKKDRVYRVTQRAPRVFAIAPEDWIVPPGSRGDIQRDRWVALRFWYTRGELEERARTLGWNIENAMPVAQFDLVRLQHERKANMRGAMLWREVYEVCEVYAYFDYDDDGLDEDLLITWDRASRTILDLKFNPYDLRPVEVMRYQLRSHLPYGLGVMEMVQPFQEETTELHNYTLLNIFLANARVWAAKEGAVPEKLEIMPGSVIKVLGDDVRSGLVELKMSEVYPSAFQAQNSAVALAERRIGTSGAAGMLAKGGARTPGVTALSLLQQVNRRFSPAFDDMREKTAAAVRQAVYRYRERLLARDRDIERHLLDVMGEDRALLLHELLTLTDVERAIAIEMTASSATVNREADRQNAIQIANLMQGYYQQTVALALQAASPQLPDDLRNLLVDIAKKGTELMDRTLRTFDQVRDPKSFLVDTSIIDQAALSGTLAQQQAQAATMVVNGGIPQGFGGQSAPGPFRGGTLPSGGEDTNPSPEELALQAPPAPGVASGG